MLDPVDYDESLVVIDLEDDPVVAAAGGSETLKSADKRLADPVGVLGEWARNGCGDSGTHLLGEPVETAGTFGCDLEVVHPVDSEEIV